MYICDYTFIPAPSDPTRYLRGRRVMNLHKAIIFALANWKKGDLLVNIELINEETDHKAVDYLMDYKELMQLAGGYRNE